MKIYNTTTDYDNRYYWISSTINNRSLSTSYFVDITKVQNNKLLNDYRNNNNNFKEFQKKYPTLGSKVYKRSKKIK